jgi:uncharacterized protein
MRRILWLAAALSVVLACQAAPAQPPPAAQMRAAFTDAQIPSHGVLLNGLVYIAAGAGPHPAVILLHGFPGNERNLDLAQDIRRAGWDVLYFNYRGSWGTPGDFSFAHVIEDTAAAVAYLRQPEIAAKLRLDPARIVLIGHSMGGFAAVLGAAGDPSIRAAGMISAADMAGRIPAPAQGSSQEVVVKQVAASLAREGMAPLAGCTPEGLAQELIAHPGWSFASQVDALKGRTYLVVTSDDGLAPGNDALVEGLRKKATARITTVHLATDHAYSDQRLELSHAVLKWLKQLPAGSD